MLVPFKPSSRVSNTLLVIKFADAGQALALQAHKLCHSYDVLSILSLDNKRCITMTFGRGERYIMMIQYQIAFAI